MRFTTLASVAILGLSTAALAQVASTPQEKKPASTTSNTMEDNNMMANDSMMANDFMMSNDTMSNDTMAAPDAMAPAKKPKK